MLLPIKCKNPPETFPFATVGLILVNVAVYAATSNGLQIHEHIASTYGLTRANVGVTTLFTHMFLHGDLLHLIGNMWFLYLFGFAVEGRLRTPKFLVLYLLAGLAGAGLHLAFPHGKDLPLIGASGAIMGTLGAALYVFPHCLFLLFYWVFYFRGVAQWRMYWVALLYVGMDLIYLWAERAAGVGDGVAHLAHLGGAATGILVCLILRVRRDTEEMSDAKAMYSDLKDLRYLSVRELASMAKADPTNTTVLLNWAANSVHDVRGIGEECRVAFMAMLPKIVERESPQAVGYVLASFANAGVPMSSKVMVDVATRIEKGDDARNAASLYEGVLRDEGAADSEREVALYRMGMLSETRFANPKAAIDFYLQVARQYPMGAFGDQARARLMALGYKERI